MTNSKTGDIRLPKNKVCVFYIGVDIDGKYRCSMNYDKEKAEPWIRERIDKMIKKYLDEIKILIENYDEYVSIKNQINEILESGD